MSSNYENYAEHLESMGGNATAAITASQIQAGPVVIKAATGRLCKILVTTATTSGQAITVYDSASTGSGTIIGVVPGNSPTGYMVDFQLPALNGLTVGQNSSLASGAITVSYI